MWWEVVEFPVHLRAIAEASGQALTWGHSRKQAQAMDSKPQCSPLALPARSTGLPSVPEVLLTAPCPGLLGPDRQCLTHLLTLQMEADAPDITQPVYA